MRSVGPAPHILYARRVRRCLILITLGLLACGPGSPPSQPAPAASPQPALPAAPAPAPPTVDGPRSNLRSDEQVRIFPAIARRDGAVWQVRVHAWTYEPEADSWRRGAAVETLRAALELPPEADSSAIFRARARSFLVDNESGKALVVRIGGETHTLTTTGSDGHSETDLRIAAAGLVPDAAGFATIDVLLPEGDPRQFGGAALLLLGDTGISVISDIDDTVKISEVRDKPRLLARTFLQEFEPVAGMAAVYRRWASAGAAFHYISASPWQLYDPLDQFFRTGEFPAGSVHLKQFRAKDLSFLALFQDPIAYKRPLLADLLTRFPGRRFVLVGDSGELDPEVYGAIFREFPGQVAAIHIRDVTAEPREAPRYAAAFADVPAERWTIFTDPADLPPLP